MKRKRVICRKTMNPVNLLRKCSEVAQTTRNARKPTPSANTRETSRVLGLASLALAPGNRPRVALRESKTIKMGPISRGLTLRAQTGSLRSRTSLNIVLYEQQDSRFALKQARFARSSRFALVLSKGLALRAPTKLASLASRCQLLRGIAIFMCVSLYEGLALRAQTKLASLAARASRSLRSLTHKYPYQKW